MADSPPRIVFFHPDLGIGGAERLVIDAAVGLKSRGYKVTIYTSHRDVNHCFDEARDGTLDVRVRGDLIPATLFGRFKILFTILRHYLLLLQIFLTGELKALAPSAFFVDQLSAGIPILRWRHPDTRILFYCHYPDLLLVQGRDEKSLIGIVRRIWRLPFDIVEGWSMRGADRVVVNSRFTSGVVTKVWKGLGGQLGLGVVYPCVDTQEASQKLISAKRMSGNGSITGKRWDERDDDRLWPDMKILLSINRFERKKDIGVAIRAFAGLNPEIRETAKLVIAGGYDSRVPENVTYHLSLYDLCSSLSLPSFTAKNIATALSPPGADPSVRVVFLLSVPTQIKTMLLNSASLLLYTPQNEHFGIVPLEAMLAGVPVLAANSGGPLETVVEGETGWLRDPNDLEEWEDVMKEVLTGQGLKGGESELKRMGEKGRKRVIEKFSKTEMAKKLDEEIRAMCKRPRAQVWELQDILLALGVLPVLGFATWVLIFRVLSLF